MILFVDDNSGILFIKNVEITVEADPITGKGGSSYYESYEHRLRYSTKRKQQQVERDEEEVLLFIKIFTKVCL